MSAPHAHEWGFDGVCFYCPAIRPRRRPGPSDDALPHVFMGTFDDDGRQSVRCSICGSSKDASNHTMKTGTPGERHGWYGE